VKRFVLDASIVLTWCFPDEHSAVAQHVLDLLQQGSEADVPFLWPTEVMNGLLIGERRKRITQAISQTFLRDLEKLTVHLDTGVTVNPFIPAVESLARQYDLTAYDATYLELSIRLAVPLATVDKALLRAAPAAGVAVVTGKVN